jgi:multidrug efflux pump subunit AcrA (membrane-fusion protein)
MNARRPFLFVCLTALTWLPAAAAAEPAKQPKPETAPAAPEKAAAEKAASAKSDAEPASPAAPATHTVQRKPLKITVDLDGVFEAQSASEIALKFDEYMPAPALTVISAVKHGGRVKKGDVLVSLDAEKLDKQIDDLRTDLQLAKLGLKQAEDGLAALEKTTPLDLAANERAVKANQQDRKYYFDIERPFNLKSAEFSLRRAQNYVEYSEEELRQLEKMYQADEVTEETEAIVLKRARDQLESAKMSLESSRISRDFAIEFGIPRADEQTKESSERRQLATERARIAVPEALQRQQIEVEKQRIQTARSAERLKKLQADRERLTVRSPLDGVVYYGKCTRGKFSDAQPLADSLRAGGMVQMNQVLMTVVQPQGMSVRATVPEDQLHRLRPGLSGIAIPNGFPDLKLPAVLSQWSEIPVGPGSFDATLKVNLAKDHKAIVPGMACKVKLTAYAQKNALAVPASVVMTDEFDDQRYVYLIGKDGKAAKRNVTVGQKTDKLLEIAAGLAEGDKVLLEAPKDAK